MWIKSEEWKQINSPHPSFVSCQPDHRSPGWHVADLIKTTLIEYGLVDWGKDERDLAEMELDVFTQLFGEYGQQAPVSFELNARMLFGVGMEPVLMSRVPSISGTVHQPGEVRISIDKELDEIEPDLRRQTRPYVYGSPDGYTEQALVPKLVNGNLAGWTEGEVVEETKVTWTSAKRPVAKQLHWIWQLGAYTQKFKVPWGRLTVGYVNGGYEKFKVGDTKVVSHWVHYDEEDWANVRRMLARGVAIKLEKGIHTSE